jgi:predicted MFS family arabinose efflux permease
LIVSKARFATYAAFFVAGFAFSCWAPLVPYAKQNVGADEAQLGLLLLFIGIGSVLSMPITGVLAARIGARPVILFGGFGISAVIPFLMMTNSPWVLAGLLLLTGTTLGALDVSMNIHGAKVEEIEDRPLMSGFHALFSIGALAGAAIVTGFLSLGLSPVFAGFFVSVVSFTIMLVTAPHLMRARAGKPEPIVRPKGVVLLLSLLTGIMFLTEGAMLDWGALLLIDRNLAQTEGAGIGFIVFSIAMVVARLNGDRITRYMGAFRVIFYGGLTTAAGILLIVLAPGQAGAMLGFALVGLGASNIVPVLFSLAGGQKVMPPELAIAAISVVGYAGILMGPALIGLLADRTSLAAAFLLLAVFLAILPLTAHRATR